MKIVLALFTIALVAQVSFAEKSDYIAFKEFMFGEMKTKFEAIAKAIPDGEDYKKYNEQFDLVLDTFNKKTDELPCLAKLTLTLKKIENVYDTIKADESEEAEKIKEIYHQLKNENLGQKAKVFLEKALGVAETETDYC